MTKDYHVYKDILYQHNLYFDIHNEEISIFDVIQKTEIFNLTFIMKKLPYLT